MMWIGNKWFLGCDDVIVNVIDIYCKICSIV